MCTLDMFALMHISWSNSVSHGARLHQPEEQLFTSTHSQKHFETTVSSIPCMLKALHPVTSDPLTQYSLVIGSSSHTQLHSVRMIVFTSLYHSGPSTKQICVCVCAHLCGLVCLHVCVCVWISWVEEDPKEIMQSVYECMERTCEKLHQLNIDISNIKGGWRCVNHA